MDLIKLSQKLNALARQKIVFEDMKKKKIVGMHIYVETGRDRHSTYALDFQETGSINFFHAVFDGIQRACENIDEEIAEIKKMIAGTQERKGNF